MAKIRFCLSLLIITEFLCYSQDSDNLFVSAFILNRVENSIGIPIENDLIFSFISFQKGGKGKIIPQTLTRGSSLLNNLHDINYEMINDTLIIQTISCNYKYKIEEKINDQIILSNGNKWYYLKRVYSIESNNIICSNDTLKLYKYSKAKYINNLFNYFIKNIPSYLYRDTSLLVKTEFILKKDGSIDSIYIESDSIVRKEIIKLILSSKKNWIIATKEDKKIDAKISFSIFIKSKEIDSIKSKKLVKISKNIFNKGHSSYIANNIEVAKKYFLTCEKLYDSYISILNYSSNVSLNENNYLKNVWISSISNLATIYYQEGEENKSCIKWEKIAIYDNEAYFNFENGCLK